MIVLSRRGLSTGKHTWDDHQSVSANFTSVGSVLSGNLSVLGTGADDYFDTCIDECLNTDITLLVSKERPVAHRSAVDDGVHTGIDQSLRGYYECVEIWGALGIARGH